MFAIYVFIHNYKLAAQCMLGMPGEFATDIYSDRHGHIFTKKEGYFSKMAVYHENLIEKLKKKRSG